MVPWAEGQVMVSPPTTVEPVQVKVHGSDADRAAFEQSVAAFEVKEEQ